MITVTKSFSDNPSIVNEHICVDHGIVDEHGRKIGGRAELTGTLTGAVGVRIQSTRDGVAFGATRKAVFYRDARAARIAAVNKLQKQRERVREMWERQLAATGSGGPL